MTDPAAVERRIGEIFEHKLNLPEASSGIDLFESGALDSFSFFELLLQLELEYGFRIRLQEVAFDDFRSIGGIAAFVRRRLAAADARPQPGAEQLFAGLKCPA